MTIPPEVHSRTQRTVSLLESGQHPPGLQVHKITDVEIQQRDLWTARLNDKFRLFFKWGPSHRVQVVGIFAHK